jgi:hypothetical protein
MKEQEPEPVNWTIVIYVAIVATFVVTVAGVAAVSSQAERHSEWVFEACHFNSCVERTGSGQV